MQSLFLALLICPFLILEIWFPRLVFHRSLFKPFPFNLTLLREFKRFLIIWIKHHCHSSHILVVFSVLSVLLHFVFIPLPFLLYFFNLFFLVSFLFLFSCLPNEFRRPFCFCFMYVMFIVPFAVICFIRRVWCVRLLLPTYTSLYPSCFMQYVFYLSLVLFHCSIFPFFGPGPQQLVD
jgi:hypothetical protein